MCIPENSTLQKLIIELDISKSCRIRKGDKLAFIFRFHNKTVEKFLCLLTIVTIIDEQVQFDFSIEYFVPADRWGFDVAYSVYLFDLSVDSLLPVVARFYHNTVVEIKSCNEKYCYRDIENLPFSSEAKDESH